MRKEHDHAMDDMRYFAATVLGSGRRSFRVGGGKKALTGTSG